MGKYALLSGDADYDRLLLLARDRWPDTSALLRRAGVAAGQSCVDLGCGGGAVTVEIARLVAPGGSVIGVDLNETGLDLARRAAAAQGLENVEFRRQDVGEWDEPGCYDVVYSRFLLQHLSRPVDLLRRMWAAVRPGGVLVVEDADHEGWCCDPPEESFDLFADALRHVIRRRGGDPAIGRRLPACFLEAAIPHPEVSLVQSVWTEGEEKTLAYRTFEASAAAVVSEGIAAEQDVVHALAALQDFTAEPVTLICLPRVFQLWSRRPV